jgi:hypothetical protein
LVKSTVTHSSFIDGIWTCPKTGLYSIRANIQCSQYTPSGYTTQTRLCIIKRIGTDKVLMETYGHRIQSGSATCIPISHVDVLFVGNVIQGDKILITFEIDGNNNNFDMTSGVLEIYAL